MGKQLSRLVLSKVATRLEDDNLEALLESIDAMKWGVLLHTALLFLEGTGEECVEAAVYRAFCVLGEKRNREKLKRAIKEVKKVLAVEGIEEIFPADKGQVLAERAFLDEEGNLLRPDRVVIYPHKAVVVDFKSRKPANDAVCEKYRKQVRDYIGVVSKALNKPVEGYLLFIKEGQLEKVGG